MRVHYTTFPQTSLRCCALKRQKKGICLTVYLCLPMFLFFYRRVGLVDIEMIVPLEEGALPYNLAEIQRKVTLRNSEYKLVLKDYSDWCKLGLGPLTFGTL